MIAGCRTITIVKTLADRIREARELMGWSQAQLAKEAGISQSTIGNIEAGTRHQPRSLMNVAAALHRRPKWLQTGQGPEFDDATASPVAPAPTAEQMRLLDVWGRLSKNQRTTLMDQLQATAASNIEIAEHLHGLGIKNIVPDDEVARKLLGSQARLGSKKGKK